MSNSLAHDKISSCEKPVLQESFLLIETSEMPSSLAKAAFVLNFSTILPRNLLYLKYAFNYFSLPSKV